MLARDAVAALLPRVLAERPRVVAIDGRSGSGKSTLAAALAQALRKRGLTVEVIEGDDFFAGGVSVRPEPAAVLVDLCIDWRRQREVLERLRGGLEARWHRFDWEAFDGSLEAKARACEPAEIVVLEGVYSGRPELADLVDLKVLVSVADEVRQERLLAREGEIGPWERQWHEAEDVYFSEIAPDDDFDVVLG